MKKIIYLISLVVILAACGRNADSKHAVAVENTAEHAHGEDCDHDHESTENHDDHSECDHGHDDHTAIHDLEECDGDHDSHDGGDSHEHDNDDAHAGHDHSNGAGEDVDEIIFPVAQAQKTDFEVSKVVPGTFNEVIRTAGRIMPAQGDEASVVAPVSGVVKLAGTVTEGSAVAKGGRMFYISSKNVTGGDVLARNKAAYDKAVADMERVEAMYNNGTAARKEYDEARLAYEQAKAGYEALASTGTAQGTAVSAPLGGYVYGLTVRDGDFVETGQVMAVVSQNRNLTLRAEVSQKYMPRLSRVVSANFVTPYDGQCYRLADLNGKLLSVGRNTLSGSSLVPVTFQFNNTASVIPGTIVEVSLLGAMEDDVITLPLTAITEQQGLYYVYVQLDAEGYERREVKLGADDGMRVKILSGIRAGESVVTRGAINVKMAAASGAIPHGHEH